MKKIIGSRQTGKTRILLNRSAAENMPILVLKHDTAELLKKRAKDAGITIPEPITIDDLEKHRGHSYEEILVDDAEYILKIMLAKYGYSVNTMAINIDDGNES